MKKVVAKVSCGVGAIDKAHRIGPLTENKEKFQHIIVRLKSFKDRTKVYMNRKKDKKAVEIA